MKRVLSGWPLTAALLELLGLMLWVGGLGVILIAIIPAVFNTLGMETGGRFLRRVFDSYNMLVSGVVVLLLTTTAIRAWTHSRSPHSTFPVSRVQWGLLVSMGLVTVLIVIVLGPKAIQLQEQAFAAEGEEAKKMAYEAFFRTHMIVRALHLFNVALAFSFLVVRFRQWVGIGRVSPNEPNTDVSLG